MLASNYFEKEATLKNYWTCSGDFDDFNGKVEIVKSGIKTDNEVYSLSSKIERDNYGVVFRNDILKNISDKTINIRDLKSRFIFEGGEYEVYTQYNNWQSESIGGWQELVTEISASCRSVRTTQNATPFMVLWSKQENRGVVFHILPNCAWEMKVTHVGMPQKYSRVMVEIGINSYNFNCELKNGEVISLPPVICYETKNKIDFDCYKLHNFMHNKFPRSEMPLFYNTWLYKFTDFTPDDLFLQAEYASKLGLEYFVVDAGWFGNGQQDWFTTVGDWEENLQGGLYGRMKELSKRVNDLGMKFGLWFEPERAAEESKSVKNNPEFYFKEGEHYFLDFSNPDARNYILNKMKSMISKYNIDFIKFDFNADMFFDVNKKSFIDYFKGAKIFLSEIRKYRPGIYLSGCAGGGERTELNNYTLYDSFWPSDNESPYEEMRMYKETILRLPPQGFERITCVHSLDEYKDFYEPFKPYSYNSNERLIAAGDAWWKDIVGVNITYLDGYWTSGPVCLSCDLTKISEEAFKHFKDKISQIKKKREFWKKAVARILCDTKTMTVYQYSDMDLSEIVIQVFSKKSLQDKITVFPEVCEDKDYIINDKTVSGKEIKENGIEISILQWKEMSEERIHMCAK